MNPGCWVNLRRGDFSTRLLVKATPTQRGARREKLQGTAEDTFVIEVLQRLVSDALQPCRRMTVGLCALIADCRQWRCTLLTLGSGGRGRERGHWTFV